jgi:hypothetical protein
MNKQSLGSIGGSLQGEGGVEAERAIPQSISQLQFTLSSLESNLERLRERMSPVLSSVRPENTNDQGRPLNSVPLAAELTAIGDRVDTLNGLVLDLIDRLHV